VAKARIQRSTKDIISDTVLGNLVPPEEVRRITTIIYGRPMTGKTLLVMYEAARLAKMYGGGVKVYTSEANYAMTKTFNAIKSIFEALKVPHEIVFEESAERLSMELFRLTKEVQGDRESYEEENEGLDGWSPRWRVIVIDSLGSLAAAEEDHMSYYMRRHARSRSSTIIPSIARVVRSASRYAAEAHGWAFAISHATSTAGTGLYEGLVEYKPSFTEKAIHHAGAVIWLASAKDFSDNVKQKVIKEGRRLKDVKMAVLVLYRGGSAGTGKGIVFEFTEADEDGVKYPKPTPLFAVQYQHEEEELI
jgi:hypothetical protein